MTAKTDDAGQVVVDFTPVTDGTVTIDVVHPENDVYLECTAMAENSVAQIKTTIELEEPEDTIINGTTDVKVIVTDELDNPVVGQIVGLTFEDEDGNIEAVTVTTDENGEAVYVYDNTKEGKVVEVTAELVANDDGYATSETDEPEEFTVEKLDVIIDIAPEDDVTAHRPTNATITVSTEEGSIPVGEAVNVIVTQGDIELFNDEVVLDENGQVVIPFTPENTDDIEIAVIFDETDQYYDGEETESIDDVDAMGINMTVTAENTTINGTSVITINLTDEDGNPISGTVEVTIPGEDEPRIVDVDETGIATIEYVDTEEGKNVTITAELVEPTEGYEEVEPVDVTFEVAKLDTTMEIVAESPIKAHEPTSATITVSNETSTLSAGEKVTVTVKQGDTVLVDNMPFTTDENGAVVVPFVPVNTDDIVISAVFDETPVYLASDAETTIGNIKSTNTYLNITSEDVPINNTSHITVNVTDEEGNPVSGTVVLIVDGQMVEVETDDEGIAVYDYTNTTVGKEVTVTGYFEADPENGYLKSKTNSTTFEVEKLDITIDIDASEELTAHVPATAVITLTNETDDNVAGEEVTVTITDEAGNVLAEVTAVTDDAGQVTVDFTPVTTEPVTINVVHPENDVYNEAITGTVILDVNAMGTNVEITPVDDTAINGTTPVEVVVTDELGNPVADATVELTFDDGIGEPKVVTVTTDKDGIAVYVYDDTEDGKTVEVSAKVLADEDNGYAESEPATDEFDVDKLDVIIDIAPEDDVTAHRPTNATITVSTEEGSIPVGEAVNVIVTQGDIELFNDEVVLDENGQVVIPFTPENTDDIEIAVIFDETDQYYDGEETESIDDVDAMGINMTVTAENTTINGTSIVTINLTDEDGNPLDGTVLITIPGVDEPVPVEVKDGIGTYEFKDTEEGKNVTITAELVEPTEGYEEVEPVDVTIEIAKRETTIVIEPDAPVTAHKPTSAVITVSNETSTLPAGETVSVVVTQDGKEIASENLTTDENGQVTIPYTPFNAEHIDIVAVYNETPVYLGAENTTEVVNVKYMPTFINITSNDVIINGTSNIKVNVTDELGNPVNGTVLLIVDGDIVEVNIIEGSGLYEYTNTTVGKNVTITGYYVENTTNAYLKSEYNNTSFEVAKLNTTVKATVTNATVTNVTLDVKVDGKDTTGKVLSGKVEVFVDDVKVGEGEVVDGVARNIKLDIDEVGNYTFNIKYDGNDVFNGNETTLKDVKVTKINTTTTLEVVNNTAGNVTIEAEVLDVNGNKVPNGTVTIQATGPDGKTQTIGQAEVHDGIATVVTNLNKEGKYNFTAAYNGTDKYLPSKSAKVPEEIVGRTATVNASVVNDTLNKTVIGVTLTDDTTGEPIPNAPVEIYDENGTKVGEGKTDKNGNANITANVPVGPEELTIVYPGNDTYNTTNTTAKVDVKPRPTKTTAQVTNKTAGNVTVKATVTDKQNGKPVTNGPVDIVAVDKYGNEKIIGNGVLNGTNTVSIVTGIDEIGDYNITAKYKGNENYTESQSSLIPTKVVGRKATITPKVTNSTLGNTTVNVTLTDPATGEPIPNAPITVKLPNGTEIPATTDSNGSVVVPVDVPVGKQNVVINYPGNETYSPAKVTVPIDVAKRPTKTTGKVTNRTAGNVTITANVTDKTTGESIPNGPVTATVDGKVVGKGTVKDGVATIVTNITDKGKYNITLDYGGNKNFTNSSATLKNVDVVGRKSAMNATVNNNTVGNASVNVTLTDPVTGKPLANAPVEIYDENGTKVGEGKTDKNGNAVIPVNVPAGRTKLNVTSPGDSTYAPVSKSVTMDAKLNVNITIQPINTVKINKTYLINATVKDSYGNLVKEGNVQLFVNGTDIGTVKLTNGTIYKNYFNKQNGVYPVEARYLGTSKYNKDTDNTTVEVIKLETRVDLNDMEAVIGDTIEFVAKVTDENNHKVTEGTVVIKLNGVTLKDANGTPVSAKVENGVAKVKFTVPLSWRGSSYNITAVYSGTNRIYEASRGGPNKLTMKYRTANINLAVSPGTSSMDKTVKFIATVTDNSTKAKLQNGVVIFKLNGQTLKDASGNPIQVQVVNGQAVFNYTVPDGMKARNYTINATYSYKDFYGAKTNATLTIEPVDTHFNVTATVSNGKLSIKGKLLDPSNHATVGTTSSCIKINGETYGKDSGTSTFAIVNGTVDITVDIPSKFANTTIRTLEMVAGATYAYNACRQNITDIKVQK